MKHLLLSYGVILLGLLVAVQVSNAQIRNSEHDLSSSSTTSGPKSTNTDEVCVFCHTPHTQASTTVLWNRTDPAGPYTPYSSPTMEQTVGQPAGVSKNCLSCHDGTVAFNSLLRNPEGGVPTMTEDHMSGDDSLGVDLSNDHPVSLVYSTSQATDAGLRAASMSGTHVVVTNGSISLPLYGTTTANATIECASCHDPHLTTHDPFLREANTASQICFTCHNK